MASYTVKLGMEAKIYYNSGTYAVPIWNVMGNAKDVNLNLEKATADGTTRDNNGWRAWIASLIDGTVDFEALWLSRNAGFKVIKRAFFKNETLEMAIMDGDIATAGSEGLRAKMIVSNMSRAEPLEDGISASVTLKPAVSDYAPYWYTVESIETYENTAAAGAPVYYEATDEKATFFPYSYTEGAQVACTGVAVTDKISSVAHGLLDGEIVIFQAGAGAISTGLTAEKKYYVVNKAADDFEVALTAGGAAIDLTADGGAFFFRKLTQSTANEYLGDLVAAFTTGVDTLVYFDETADE